MLRNRFRSHWALVTGLAVAGFLLGAPRHAWAQG
jgi:hypothetical protein